MTANRPTISPAAFARALTIALPVLIGGCAPEEKVVDIRGPLVNLSGAQGGLRDEFDRVRARQNTATPDAANVIDDAADPSKLVVQNADGSVTLTRTEIRHVMVHLMRELEGEKDDLLLQQVLSRQTLDHWAAQGVDGPGLVAALRENRDDISRMFARMPAAEKSPSVRLEAMGGGVMKLALVDGAATNMRFVELWVRLERDGWRFLWVR